MGYVLITRQGPMGEVAVAMFLVDMYCLGVKDALGALRSPSDAKQMVENLERQGNLTRIPPGLARGLVEGAIAYARSLGFEPHPDYRKAAPIWGDIQAESIEGHFEFGKNGRPHFTSGPFDDIHKQQFIKNTLERTVGSDNYDFTVMLGPPSGAFPMDFVDEEFDDESEHGDADEGSQEIQLLEDTIDAAEHRRIDPNHQ
jgi:hypothetical protein